MTPEIRTKLEAYLNEKAVKGHFEAGFEYDEKTHFVKIKGVSVAGGTKREDDHSVRYDRPEDVTAVRAAIDHIAEVLST